MAAKKKVNEKQESEKWQLKPMTKLDNDLSTTATKRKNECKKRQITSIYESNFFRNERNKLTSLKFIFDSRQKSPLYSLIMSELKLNDDLFKIFHNL